MVWAILFNPILFYPLLFLGALIILAIAMPIFSVFVAGTLFKIIFVFGALVISYLLFKEMSKGRVPVITGTLQIVLIMVLGFMLPSLLSKLGLQSIVVPTFSALGGEFVTLPLEIPSPLFWMLGLVAFLLFLESQRKISKRFGEN